MLKGDNLYRHEYYSNKNNTNDVKMPYIKSTNVRVLKIPFTNGHDTNAMRLIILCHIVDTIIIYYPLFFDFHHVLYSKTNIKINDLNSNTDFEY